MDSEHIVYEMYRGIGEGADITSGFEWYSETPALAQKYADFRGGKVKKALVKIKQSFNVGNPHAVHNANTFFAEATKQVKDVKRLDRDKVLAARKDFLAFFGDKKIEVIDFWSSPPAKEVTRSLLEALGFDSIEMIEANEKTIAVLRSTGNAD